MQKRDERIPARAQHRDQQRRRDHDSPPLGPRPRRDIAVRRPPQQPVAAHKPWLSGVEHERAVGEVAKRRRVAPLGACRQVEALGVQPRVHLVGGRPAAAGTRADVQEAVVVGSPAEGAGAVAGGKRGRLVEKEQLGEPARPQQAPALPAAEFKLARDPAPAVVVAADSAGGVMQAAAISIDETPARVGDQLAEWRDPVLERHCDAP